MPLQATKADGKPAIKWGSSGKAYKFTPSNPASRERAKKKANKQAVAVMYAQGKDKPELESEIGPSDFANVSTYNPAATGLGATVKKKATEGTLTPDTQATPPKPSKYGLFNISRQKAAPAAVTGQKTGVMPAEVDPNDMPAQPEGLNTTSVVPAPKPSQAQQPWYEGLTMQQRKSALQTVQKSNPLDLEAFDFAKGYVHACKDRAADQAINAAYKHFADIGKARTESIAPGIERKRGRSHVMERSGFGRTTDTKVDRDAGIIYGLKILGAHSDNGRLYTESSMRNAIPLYEGVKVNINHPPRSKPHEDRAVEDRFGKFINVRFESGGLVGDLLYLKSHPLAESVCEAADRPELDDAFGFSHNAIIDESVHDGQCIVEAITRVQSVDLVADPATTRSLFESVDRSKQMDSGQPTDGTQAVTADAQATQKPAAPQEEQGKDVGSLAFDLMKQQVEALLEELGEGADASTVAKKVATVILHHADLPRKLAKHDAPKDGVVEPDAEPQTPPEGDEEKPAEEAEVPADDAKPEEAVDAASDANGEKKEKVEEAAKCAVEEQPEEGGEQGGEQQAAEAHKEPDGDEDEEGKEPKGPEEDDEEAKAMRSIESMTDLRISEKGGKLAKEAKQPRQYISYKEALQMLSSRKVAIEGIEHKVEALRAAPTKEARVVIADSFIRESTQPQQTKAKPKSTPAHPVTESTKQNTLMSVDERVKTFS